MKRDLFKNCHPIVNFAFYFAVLGCSMFIMHPFILAISLISAIAYAVTLTSAKQVLLFNFKFTLPGLLVVLAINPIFTHYGVTPLVTLSNGNSITLEAIVYGLVLGSVLVVATNWFTSLNLILTHDKFIDIIGRILPKIGLLLSLSFRFVPLFIQQFKKTIVTQASISQGIHEGKLLTRLKNAFQITGFMFGWTMQKALNISDAMQLRAYGTHKRKLYRPNVFDRRNKILLTIIGVLTGVVIASQFNRGLYASYNPIIKVSGLTIAGNIWTILGTISFGILANLPLLLHVLDQLEWHRAQQKISQSAQNRNSFLEVLNHD